MSGEDMAHRIGQRCTGGDVERSPHGYEVGSDLAEDLDRHLSGYIIFRDL